jgi:hypothetical protein
VIVYGDCEPVMNQLIGTWKVGQLQWEFDQVQALIRKYRAKGNRVSFNVLNDSDETYWRVDQLAKRSRTHVTGILKMKKPKSSGT